MSEREASKAFDSDALALELTRASGRFSRIAGRATGTSFSLVAWRVLNELERYGPARVSELAQQQRVAQPSMTGLVKRLESEGWVERGPDPADGRATRVAITRRGGEALDRYRRAAAERVRPHLAELSDFDRATLARAAELMQRLSDRIEDPRA